MPDARLPSRAKATPIDGSEYAAWADFRYEIRRWARISDEAAANNGLLPRHYQMLLAIKGFPQDEPPRIADLAERMQLRHHSTVGLLDRMEQRGLIERHPTGEGRAVAIVITPEADRLLAAISDELQPELRAAATHLIDTLSELVPEPTMRRNRKVAPPGARPAPRHASPSRPALRPRPA